MISDALSVHIVSPAPIADQPSLNWAYGPTLTARVSVRGAKPAFIEPNKPKRIYLALNGQELAVPSGRWVYSTTAGSLSLTLPLNAQTDLLRPGLNALVCSVSGGKKNRYERAFLCRESGTAHGPPRHRRAGGGAQPVGLPCAVCGTSRGGSRENNVAQPAPGAFEAAGMAAPRSQWYGLRLP